MIVYKATVVALLILRLRGGVNVIVQISKHIDTLPSHVRPYAVWFIRAIAVGITLTIWSTYALFDYVGRYGARAPFEGVAFSTFISLVLGFFIGVFGFVVFEGTRTIVEDLLKGSLKHRSDGRFSIVKDILILLFWPAMSFSALMIVEFFSWLTNSEDINWARNILLSAAFVVPFSIAYFFPKPHSKWPPRFYLAMYLIGAFYALHISTGNGYAEFLRGIRYGGGVPVSVVTADGTTQNDVGLFLRTTSSITVYDRKSDTFSEYPLNALVKITYLPSRNTPPILPSRIG